MGRIVVAVLALWTAYIIGRAGGIREARSAFARGFTSGYARGYAKTSGWWAK